MNNNGFNKQRKNFMLCSLFLIFLKTSGVELSKINFLGNELNITSPHYLDIWVIVIWVYYAWRFFSYSDLSKTWHSETSKFICDKLQSHYYIKNGSAFPTEVIQNHAGDFIVGSGMHTTDENNVLISKYSCEVTKLRIVGWIKQTMFTHHFTEYLLPYLLGILAFLITA